MELFFHFFFSTTVLFLWDFSHGKSPRESQLRQSRATQPRVHSGCFSVSIVHRTLTWTTGSLTCAQMQMYTTAHGGCTDTEGESALQVDSGRNIPGRTGESNLRGRRTNLMLYQRSYIPIPIARQTKSVFWPKPKKWRRWNSETDKARETDLMKTHDVSRFPKLTSCGSAEDWSCLRGTFKHHLWHHLSRVSWRSERDLRPISDTLLPFWTIIMLDIISDMMLFFLNMILDTILSF